MTPETLKAFLRDRAPDLEVVDLPEPHTTEYISKNWGVLPAQVAKTLTMRVGDRPALIVACGDSRLDNRKLKHVLGGKAKMLPGAEASEITGHPVGGITPLCVPADLPVYFDLGLKRYDEVVTAAGSTHAAIRIPPNRFAEIVSASWVDVCRDED